MKNLDLNKYGVQEMNAGEMVNVDGGNPVFFCFLAIAAVFAMIFAD